MCFMQVFGNVFVELVMFFVLCVCDVVIVDLTSVLKFEQYVFLFVVVVVVMIIGCDLLNDVNFVVIGVKFVMQFGCRLFKLLFVCVVARFVVASFVAIMVVMFVCCNDVCVKNCGVRFNIVCLRLFNQVCEYFDNKMVISFCVDVVSMAFYVAFVLFFI